MDHYVTGGAVKRLREGLRMTQSQLAEKLNGHLPAGAVGKGIARLCTRTDFRRTGHQSEPGSKSQTLLTVCLSGLRKRPVVIWERFDFLLWDHAAFVRG